MSLQPHADNMNHFTGPNPENDAWFARLNSKDQQAMNTFVQRANAHYTWVKTNGYPAGYEDSVKIYNEFLSQGGRSNSGQINVEDLYALDQTVSQTIWDADTFSKLGIPTQVMEKPRFELKDYLLQSEEKPRFSREFRRPHFLRMKESSQFTNGVGLHLGLSIPFTELAESEGALWSPRAYLMQELAALMGLYKSRRGFLGTSCQGALSDDGTDASLMAITGLFNYGSKQTQATGIGGDNNMADQGDVEFTIRALFGKLRKAYQPGKFVIVSSAGVAGQMFYERDTYQQQLDVQRVKELLKFVNGFQEGSSVEWWVTDQLYAATAAYNKGQILLAKVGPATINRKIIYPQQMLPMLNKEYERDLQENMIFADLLQVKKTDTTNNVVPIVTNDSDITTDNVSAFIPEGVRII